MTDRLQVVTSALLVSDVRVDGRVARRAREILAFSERDMLVV